MKIFKAITFFTFCLVSFQVLAQKKPVINQDPKTFRLFFEKTYLQLDRTYYNSGEDIWFAAYLVNGKSASLTSTSNNLYVELINPKSEIIDRKLIHVEQGLGNGDFKLKDTIKAGWYTIRAYTNWMRNFNDDFVFQKKIYINNATVSAAEKPSIVAKKTIAFFPEGGALVEGLPTIVAFKSTDELGNGLKTNGSIISSKGDTITTFQSTEVGMGGFAFTPAVNEEYKVAGNYNNEKFTTALPMVLKKGFSLHVKTDSANIKTTISANEVLFNELKGKPISVVIKHAGDVIYSGSLNLSKTSVSINIPSKNFPTGVAVLTVLDHLGRPNCERLVYIQSANPINFTIAADKASYGPREKVTLNIKANNFLGQPVKTAFSLAVVDGLIPTDASNIVSYLMLQSEVKGEIKDVDQYFDLKNTARFKQLDLLLLTQGWREYLWRRLSDTTLSVSHLPEPGITIKGVVREKLKNKPLPDMNITVFGSNFTGNKLFTTKTDAAGRYFLDGLKWYDNQAIKISSQDGKGKSGGWLQIDSSFVTLPISLRKTIPSTIFGSVNDELAKRRAYNVTNKIGETIMLDEVTVLNQKNLQVQLFNQTLTSFGYPDQIFNITAADYDFKGLEHFLLTKVDGAQSADGIEETDSLDTNTGEGIAFLADGKKVRPRIMINNREDIQDRLDYYSLTMDQINKITVKHLMGNTGTGTNHVYVISLDLKDSALQGPNLHLLNLNLNGYYTARAFYAPNYASTSSTKQDLRTTIFWAPLLKTSDNGALSVSFYNGDNKGEMIIKAGGITDSGTAVATKTSYKVQ